MTIVTAAEAPLFEVQPGVAITGFGAPSRGAAEVCTWQLRVEPGTLSGAHLLDADETFIILSGSLCVTPGGSPVEAGGVVTVPAGGQIQVSNPGEVAAEAVVAIRSGFTAIMIDGTRVGTPPWAL